MVHFLFFSLRILTFMHIIDCGSLYYQYGTPNIHKCGMLYTLCFQFLQNKL
jgi:hypothetical protein